MPSLGDAIYCRPFIKPISDQCWLNTKWPDLFCDMSFKSGMPSGKTVSPRYDSKNLAMHSVPGAIAQHFPLRDSLGFDMPDFGNPDIKQYAVIRPPTIRADFDAPARNPDPDYICRAVDMLNEAGFITVGVGNVREGVEDFQGKKPDFSIDHCYGDLTIPELMKYVSHADMIVAGPGYTVPASIAYGVPHITIYGGTAKWNKPSKLVEPWMDDSKLISIFPDNFCHECKTVKHDCSKSISRFDERFIDAIDQALSVR